MRGGRVGGITSRLILVTTFGLACAGGAGDPAPAPGFGMLSGRTVLVLPVQYVRPTPGGWPGGGMNETTAARAVDAEIAFALNERGGRATWILPQRQDEVLQQRPSIAVNPYILSADEIRNQRSDLRRIRDPLYGEIRTLAALFDSRFAVWPLEVFYEPPGEEGGEGRMAIRTLLLDARVGDVLWQGLVHGSPEPPSAGVALASAAQAFADQVTP